MKNIYRIFGVAVSVLLMSFIAPSAFANTFAISNDPIHAEQFSFYCEPYMSPFEPEKHYIVGGINCIYSVPNTLTGDKTLTLYKGTPGVSATQVGGDSVFHAGTLINQSPNIFSSPQNDDDFFAVIYDYTLDQTAAPLANYLTGATSTIPAGVVEGQNFFIIPWKWGPKPANEFDPVVVLPDVLTTWQTDSGMVIDPIFNTYTNLLETFEQNGYVAEQTLFTLPYDWETSGATVATLLQNKIQDVKSVCNCDVVDVIAHGTAGLAATQYVIGGSYQNDIDQLVLVGTPFNGVAGAYPAWDAGLIQFDEPLRNGLAQLLLAQEATVGSFASVFDYVQNKPVTSFLEMLPVTNYLSGKTYPTGYPQNPFLENIQNNFFPTIPNSVRPHQFDSTSSVSNTTNSFTIAPSSQPPLWPHGQPTATQKAKGDGMVTFSSAEFLLNSDVALNNIKHHDLPTAVADDIFATLNGGAPTTVVTNAYPVSCVLFLTTSPTADMQITDPNGDRLGKDFTGSGTFAEIDRSVYSGPNALAEYLAVANPIDGVYEVRTQGTTNSSFTLTANDVCTSATHSTTTTATTAPGQVLGFEITVNPDDTINIEPLDTGAPVVAITSPAQGATHLTTDTVPVTVSVVDPEGSAIAETTYHLNGTAVDPEQSLPLSTQPLGSAVFVVSATDVFGNKGYATSTFTIEEPAPEIDFFFLDPITAEGHQINANTSVFKAGSTVPVKFELRNASGGLVQAAGAVAWIAPIKGPALNAPVSESVYTIQPSSGSAYEWKGSHYQYNWKTSKSQSGYWYYLFVNVDGEIHQTIIGLR